MSRHLLPMMAGVALAAWMPIQTVRADISVGATASASADAYGPFEGTNKASGLLYAETQAHDLSETNAGATHWTTSADSLSRVDATGVDPALKLQGYAYASQLGAGAPGAPIAVSESTWQDIFRPVVLTAEGSRIMAAHPTLYAKIHVAATYDLAIAPGPGTSTAEEQVQLGVYNTGSSGVTASFLASLSGNSPDSPNKNAYGQWDDLTDSDGALSGDLTIPVYYNYFNNQYDYQLQYYLSASAYIGWASLDSEDSFHLVGLTLADGTTPESHGIEITTASGMASPNLQAVPEPSGLARASTALLMGLAYAIRRKAARARRAAA